MKNIDLDWHGEKVGLFERKAAEKGVAEAAEYILAMANKKVPHDEGTLERSGVPDVNGIKATISYDTKYAAYLHENPQFEFQKGREGKWLEKTVKNSEVQKKVRDHIGQKIEDALS